MPKCRIIFSNQLKCINCNTLIHNDHAINKLKKFYNVEYLNIDTEELKQYLLEKNLTRLPILEIMSEKNGNIVYFIGLNDILNHINNLDNKNKPIYKYVTLNKIKNEKLNDFDIVITDEIITDYPENIDYHGFDIIFIKEYKDDYLKLIIPKLFLNNKILIISNKKKLKPYLKALYDVFILNHNLDTVFRDYKIENNLKSIYINS